jgi:NADH:ubiquinone oxidoreductase subunit K
MRDPVLEKKLRDYRFEQLELRFSIRYLVQGIIAVVVVTGFLVAVFRGQWPAAVFLTLAAAGLAVVAGVAMQLSRRRALAQMRRELPADEPYEPPGDLL